ncbi:hypothetical protein [Streptomyces sp. A1547]|uniref:hypothetical protein n=1 Tax=Streptomyces sp. A1547 TaxID=2563105 RepID=UPI00109E451A|nr:hypothetical protein [Streptomyces sp. A1547]THA28458.1 hypothetical protein E6W17_40925 [Streptomyces sp. A1547]
MHSMTAALAAHTMAPPDPAATQDKGWIATTFETVWNFGSDHLPGGNLTMVGLLWALGAFADSAQKRKKAGGPTGDRKGFFKGLVSLFQSLWGALVSLAKAVRAVARFYGGYETRGEARSDATFFRAGTRLIQNGPAGPAVQLGSIALAPPKVSLVKPKRRQPSARARRVADWLVGYQGRAARALYYAVRIALGIQWLVAGSFRVARAVWGFLRRVYGAVAPVVAAVALVLRMWHRWPYALRGLARLALTAAALGLAVPAWRTWTIVLLVLALAAVVVLAQRWKPKQPGDDAVYGPRLWAILRTDLGLAEDEIREHWLQLPEKLGADGARIVLRLPWDFRGSQHEKDNVTALINSRLPGEWVGRYSFREEHFTAVYTHKPPTPPPAPKPTPPKAVDIAEPRVQEALANLAPEEFLLGADENNELVIRKMAGEVSHWAYSVGSGGGKSTTLQWLAVQMVMKRGIIVGIDPKLISLAPLAGVPGVYLYKDPENGLDMRRALHWVADVVMARFYEIEQGTATEFDPLYVFLEETNELAGILRNVWNKIRTKTGEDKDPAADPIWEEAVARILRFGRAANVHLLAVFQDFKDNEFSGQSLRPLFQFKVLGSYDPHQWERITGLPKAIMPPSVKKAGRMVTVTDGVPFSYQTPYLFIDDETAEDGKRPATEQEANDLYGKLYRELRERHGWSNHGLYSEPPANSPRGIPRLLRGRLEGLSRDADVNGPQGGSEGGLSDETAGRLSHGEGHVTGSEADVTPLRDRLRLIPGQAGKPAQEPTQDPTAPPELLPLAEVSRRLGPADGVPKYDTLRAHKTRREDFPKATVINGKELYTESQILAYYQQQEKKA